jgi:hypothetical protein
MRSFVVVVVLSAVLAFAGVAHGGEVRVTTLAPVEDVSLPFWCDWGYDWDERCYSDDGARLAVGGEPGKVWRSALRFSTTSVPADATIVTAELALWYDRTCVAPRKTSRPCDGRAFQFDAHPIYTPNWFAEREVEFGPVIASAGLQPFASAQWVVWDLTDIVAEWTVAGSANSGVLIKLVDGQEDYDVSGPLFPSSSYANAALRPRVAIWYQLE